MGFKQYYIKSLIKEANVDIFDDVIKKATKEIFKVVDIIVRGGQRIFRLAPVGKKNAKEFDIDNRTFNKEFVAT